MVKSRKEKDKNHNLMYIAIKFYLYIAFILLFIVSVWSIGAIDLGVLPKLEIEADSGFVNGLNRVLTNLSYSYLAGWIIYGLTVCIPIYYRRARFESIIDQKL